MNWEDYVAVSEKYFRPNEVNHLLGDYTKAKNKLGWEPNTNDNLVKMMVESDMLLEKEKS